MYSRREAKKYEGPSTSRTESGRSGPYSRDRSKPLVVGTKYLVGKKLARGNFGQLYLGKNVETNEDIAIKMEPRSSKNPQLLMEFKYYKTLGALEGTVGLPNIYFYGPADRFNCLVMELLGPNLEDLFKICGRLFSPKTVLTCALQLLDRFQYIHSKGIIYRDVKPENFVVGRSENGQAVIHVVDFGLAKYYIDRRTREHIPYKENKSLTGTARYMSINTHLGREQSRRDDMEALGHLFVYFLRGSLPWQGLPTEGSAKERYYRIGELKRNLPIAELCDGFPEVFADYLRYSRALEFYSEPNYDYLKGLFHDLLKTSGFVNNEELDWSNKIPELNDSN